MDFLRIFKVTPVTRYAAAEKDCDISLSLDDQYVKAWMRRATAKAKLKKYESATEGTGLLISHDLELLYSLDIEMVLKLEPNNKHAKTELERLQKVCIYTCLFNFYISMLHLSVASFPMIMY